MLFPATPPSVKTRLPPFDAPTWLLDRCAELKVEADGPVDPRCEE